MARIIFPLDQNFDNKMKDSHKVMNLDVRHLNQIYMITLVG